MPYRDDRAAAEARATAAEHARAAAEAERDTLRQALAASEQARRWHLPRARRGPLAAPWLGAGVAAAVVLATAHLMIARAQPFCMDAWIPGPGAFDVVAFAPTAQRMAEDVLNDPVLVEVDIDRVDALGHAVLGPTGVTYRFAVHEWMTGTCIVHVSPCEVTVEVSAAGVEVIAGHGAWCYRPLEPVTLCHEAFARLALEVYDDENPPIVADTRVTLEGPRMHFERGHYRDTTGNACASPFFAAP